MFGVRFRKDRPLSCAHQQVSLRDLGNTTDVVEMQMGQDRRPNVTGGNACAVQNMVDPVGQRQVQSEYPRQRKAPDFPFDIARVGHDRGVDAGVEQNQAVPMPDQSAIQRQRHPGPPQEEPPKPGHPAAVTVLFVLLCAPALQNPNRRDWLIGSVRRIDDTCLRVSHQNTPQKFKKRQAKLRQPSGFATHKSTALKIRLTRAKHDVIDMPQ